MGTGQAGGNFHAIRRGRHASVRWTSGESAENISSRGGFVGKSRVERQRCPFRGLRRHHCSGIWAKAIPPKRCRGGCGPFARPADHVLFSGGAGLGRRSGRRAEAGRRSGEQVSKGHVCERRLRSCRRGGDRHSAPRSGKGHSASSGFSTLRAGRQSGHTILDALYAWPGLSGSA